MLHVKLTLLSTKKLDNLAEQTIVLSEQNANQEIVTHPLFLSVKSSYEPYHANIIKPTFSGLGVEVAQVNLLRDNCHGGLKRVLRGFLAFGDTPKGMAAKQLLGYFDETGSIARLGYAEENIVVKKLIEKLTAPEAQKPIDLLGIRQEVDQLIDTQTGFMQLYTQQINANSALRQQPSASVLRRELGNALRSYYGYISVMSGIEPWKDIHADLKELIAKSK
jgi:hypothetical protein